MKLERIHLKNFLSHKDTNLDLSKVSLLAIMGQNAAGKSSLFDGLIWGWFGKVNSRGTKSDAIARYDTDETSVTIEWYINDIHYKLVRIRDNKKGSQKLELTVNGEIISERKKTEVEELLSNILKIPQDLYAITNGLQQDGKSFLDLKPSERKAYLSNILQLDNYKKVQMEAKSTKSRLNSEKTGFEGQLKAIEDELVNSESQIKEREDLLEKETKLDADLAKVTNFLNKAAEQEIEEKQKQFTERTKLEATIELKQKTLSELRSKYKTVEIPKDDFSKKIEDLTYDLDSFKNLNSKLADEINEHKGKLSLIVAEYKKAQSIANDASSLEANVPCPTCYQNVSEEHIDKIKNLYEEQAEQHRLAGQELKNLIEKLAEEKTKYADDIQSINEKIDHFKFEARKADQIAKQIKDMKDQEIQLTEDLEELNKKVSLISSEQIPEELLAKIKQAEMAKKNFEIEKKEITKKLTQIDLLEEQIKRQKVKKDEIQTKVQELEDKVQLYNLIIDACHPQKGIPAKIIENSLYPLEKIANDLLQYFPGTYKFSIYFKTLTDDGKETLELMVKTSNSKADRYYEQLSGGEKMRVNLALRIALIRMINNMYGIENRTLIIDEGFHSLSVDIRASAFEILASLQGIWFDKILTITHSPEVADCIPHRLELKKDEINDCTVIAYKNF